MTTNNYDTAVIDNIITGYLPHSIYAFETNTHPNYLKVGDTNRRVEIRLNEWRKVYSNLVKKYEAEAMLEDEHGEKTIFFRDYALHDYLLNEKNYKKLSEKQYESEFFKYATVSDIESGINDIKNAYIKEGIRKYNYYQVGTNNSQEDNHWKRTQDYRPRPNQEQVIKNIVAAVEKGRTNLLLYAVMRFGKSNVSIWAAKELDSKLTVIVTGKADVKTEWKKTVESHKDFENIVFTDSIGFTEEFAKEHKSNNIVVFTTLQDLAGSQENLKVKHELLFKSEIDFLVIDESHFGARAKIYSKALINKEDADFDELIGDEIDNAVENINSLNSKVKLHLSGTPYRILLSGEFSEADIVGRVQFTDILESKKNWISENIEEAEEKPWENPYFGFPEMVRFAFTPNKSAVKLLENLKENGESAELNILFAPESTTKNKAKLTKFMHEADVLNLLKAIDGSEEDENIFPFLNYQKIKDGKLAQHMVFVLPYKNSADSMERLLIEQKGNFINLGSYEILNVAGNTSKFKNVAEVQNRIKEFARKNKKTITLTVNKMLTGSTVPEWDTMVFLRDTKSPQDYDQAIFRLQSPWIKEIKDTVTGEIVGKEDMKPQTLLIDFSPSRIFKIESERALVVNAAEGKSGNEQQEEQLKRNISVSPIIYLNMNKLVEATPTNIIAKIREYSADKSILDEVIELPIDDKLYSIPDILAEISRQSELGSKSSFETSANEEQDTELDGNLDNKNDSTNSQSKKTENELSENDGKPSPRQMQMYYSRILFYAFLSPHDEKNLADILANIDNNERLAEHLELKKPILEVIKAHINPFILATLDNKIENINDLRRDLTEQDILKAIAKFGRISENEVFTPIKAARLMVESLMSEEFINEYKRNPKNIIDLTSKSGVYLIMAYQKLAEAGVDKNILKDRLFAVATSHIGYEFTRAVYEKFGWNLNNLANSDSINSYQIIEEKSITQKLKKQFGDENLKFDVVIGNPPYQKKAKGTSSSDDPIYHLFMQESYKIADKVMFITPARFLFNAGKTPSSWNKEMLNDKNLSVVHYELESSKIFPGTSIPGGIVVTYRDVNIDFGKIGTFVKFKELNSIMQKVWGFRQESIRKVIYTQSKFNLEVLYDEYPQYKDIIGSKGKDKRFRQIIMERLSIFSETRKFDNDLRILGLINKKRAYRYIPRKYVEPTDWLDKYKVFVPFSNGASGTLGEESARLISTPVLGLPGEGMTQTFIGIGAYSTKEEGENLLRYIKSKFARAMLGILKVTQGNKSDTWEYVPLQDFTDASDIDWSKSATEIDQQLYGKYGLDEKEIAFIEEKVTAME
ncbi:Eco57I restriction-modification methylase domain-containing protein [Bacillus sp. MAG717A]|uniref:Eco57I restriction-modification methylase domain-containing protein n=1 Tax=Bacillus sp. MAG717A TaxID=3122078 RepID=UPI0030D4C909